MRNDYEEFRGTNHSRIYRLIRLQGELSCSVCPPNKGCNRRGKKSDNKCWKRYRKSQYKS